MYNSLPALIRCMFVSIPDREIKTLLTKHGHKLIELELRNCHSLGDIDMCPALNVLKFTLDALTRFTPEALVNVVHLTLWGSSGLGQFSEPLRLHCEHKHLSLVKVVISSGMVYVNCKGFMSNIRSPPFI
jgi:hypothetical protein